MNASRVFPALVTRAIRLSSLAIPCLLVIGCLFAKARAENFTVLAIESAPGTADEFTTQSAGVHPLLLRGWEAEHVIATGRPRRAFAPSQRDRSTRENNAIAGESRWPVVVLIVLLGIGAALIAAGVFLLGPLATARSSRTKHPPLSLLR